MNILIIEDEDDIRQTLQDLLELNGHTVLAAADGRAGVALAERQPELILCDINMPVMDGYGVLEALRQHPHCRDIPFIFLTALADRAALRRGMTLGADDYITKPFTERDILDAIAARVQRQRPLRERLEALLAERQREAGAAWSHELMTPLNGVLGGLQLIEAEADAIKPEELKDLLTLIREGAERQQRLSRQLVLHFELTQLKSAAPAPARLSCDASSGVAAGATEAATRFRREADVTAQCDEARVPLAAAHLSAAVAELVGNALCYTRPGQAVTVTCTAGSGRYTIAVTDQGPGMTAEQCRSIGPFVQFGRDRREQQGLGLGLAIAQSVAELGGGRLSLQPGPDGRGLRVTLELRCADLSAPPIAAPATTEQPPAR